MDIEILKPLFTNRALIGVLAMLISLILAITFYRIVPDKAEESEGLQAAALRYGHALSWASLAEAGLASALVGRGLWFTLAVTGAAVCYLVFITALLRK